MHGSVIFWLWNAPLEADEIRRQIRDMHNKHIGGFFIHPMPVEFRADDFPGGMPGYLSEHYFKMVRVAVECAAEYGMEAWLYDEGGWPSGTLNGELIKKYPELGGRFINEKGEITYSTSRPDLLNPEVTRIFIEEAYEKYVPYVKEYFGTVIPGFFTDEPSFGSLKSGQHAMFSPIFEQRFNVEKGYDAKEAVLRILNENDPDARQDYNEIWVKLIIENYLTPIKEWCNRNNLLFVGHFNGDDTVANMQWLLGSDIFSLLKQMDVPGCDAIWRQIHPLKPETDYSRFVSSAAGTKPTFSETFAVYGTDLALSEMKYTAAMQFVAGIQSVAPMALHYSNEGGRQITTVSNFSGADTRWDFFQHYADFSVRMHKVFARTTPVIKASVPFRRRELQRGELDGDQYNDELFRQGLALAARQITYDYQSDIPEYTGKIVPDIEVVSPIPALRTRHLKSPRGERRILVNAGLETISFKFAAPAGFNAWYDPSSGKHWAATPDQNNLISCELPFAGCMVLLTIPGKNAAATVSAAAKEAVKLDFKFEKIVRQVKASATGLIEVAPDKECNEHFCGTKRYCAVMESANAASAKLQLPGALRAMCTLRVNGVDAGDKVWPPYCWDIELQNGTNRIELDITGTPDAAITAPEHMAYLQENKFDNVYLQRCLQFEKMFPNENPLENAVIVQ